jgi:hypothetical protein
MTEPHAREQEIERTLEGKRAQGYRVEARDDTTALLLMRGRRRFFKQMRGHDERYRLTFDELGHASSQKVEVAAG